MAYGGARLTPLGRRLLAERVRSGWTISKAAEAAGISRQTGSKWIGRFRREGASGLVDRRSAVHRQARAHQADLVERVCARRRELRAGVWTEATRSGMPSARRISAVAWYPFAAPITPPAGSSTGARPEPWRASTAEAQK
jgi:hypothetical protein